MSKQQITKIEFFFMEWLIIQKQLTEEQFKELTNNELEDLKSEFSLFYSKLK